jgi:hypothetical protein
VNENDHAVPLRLGFLYVPYASHEVNLCLLLNLVLIPDSIGTYNFKFNIVTQYTIGYCFNGIDIFFFASGVGW